MKVKKARFLKLAREEKDFITAIYPEIALAGRSNVGKSSLINTLIRQKNLARTSNTPGKTRAIYFYLVDDSFCLVDLPGYGYARVSRQEKVRWTSLIEKYLSGRENLILIIHVVDIRHPPSEGDYQMSLWLRYFDFPFLVVATKADKISRGKWEGQKKVIARDLEIDPEKVIIFSSKTGEGRDKLLGVIERDLSRYREKVY